MIWGLKFLSIYNPRYSKNFVIEKQSESPDLDCKDAITGAYLGLEIKRHGNLQGDVEIDERISRGENVYFENSLGQRGNIDNMVGQLSHTLAKVHTTSYEGMNVALVIPTVFRFWGKDILTNQFEKPKFINVARGNKDKFPAGIWFFCAGQDIDLDVIDLTSL